MIRRMGLKNMTLAAFFAILTGIGAQIHIPISVLPITLQTSLVLITGILLGAKTGAVSMALYLFLGLLGLPLFVGGGGLHSIFAPSFGFIIGFIPAAWASGYISRKIPYPTPLRIISACMAGILFIYAFGLAGLYLNLNYFAGKPFTVYQTLALGFFPFIIPELLKIAATTALCTAIEKRLRFLNHPEEKSLYTDRSA